MNLVSSFVKIIVIIITGFIFNKLCNDTASIYYQSRIDSGKTTPKVYDIFHRILPDLSRFKFESEIILIMILLPFLVPIFTTENTEPVNEFVSYLIVIMFIRSFIINMTILPKDKNCDGLGLNGGCYDKIFSGHFSTGFLATLIFYKHNIITNIPVLILMNVLNAGSILAVRNHYTVDVLISIFVVLTIVDNKLKM